MCKALFLQHNKFCNTRMLGNTTSKHKNIINFSFYQRRFNSFKLKQESVSKQFSVVTFQKEKFLWNTLSVPVSIFKAGSPLELFMHCRRLSRIFSTHKNLLGVHYMYSLARHYSQNPNQTVAFFKTSSCHLELTHNFWVLEMNSGCIKVWLLACLFESMKMFNLNIHRGGVSF